MTTNTIGKVVEEAVKKAKATWIKFKEFATIKMPSGIEHEFDFSKLPTEVFAYYGKKQWLADKAASAKGTSDQEKLDLMIEAYNDAVANGVEITGEGRISIIGKMRANAKPSYETILLEKLDTLTIENCQTVINMAELGMGYKLSESLLGRIKERLKELQTS